jgi:septation ring formation regulator EzrA
LHHDQYLLKHPLRQLIESNSRAILGLANRTAETSQNLDRLEQNMDRLEQDMDRLKQLTESNAKSIQGNSEVIAETNRGIAQLGGLMEQYFHYQAQTNRFM